MSQTDKDCHDRYLHEHRDEILPLQCKRPRTLGPKHAALKYILFSVKQWLPL